MMNEGMGKLILSKLKKEKSSKQKTLNSRAKAICFNAELLSHCTIMPLEYIKFKNCLDSASC